MGRLGPLQDEQDSEQFAKDARKLLKDIGSASLETRLRVTTRLVALGPRAGDIFCAELLKGVPELVREGRKADGEPAHAATVALLEQSLALAASLKKSERFKPLVVEAIELITCSRVMGRRWMNGPRT